MFHRNTLLPAQPNVSMGNSNDLMDSLVRQIGERLSDGDRRAGRLARGQRQISTPAIVHQGRRLGQVVIEPLGASIHRT